MSKSIISNYSFDKTAKTVTFNELISVRKEGILLITNTKTGTILYQFNDGNNGGTVSGNVLTLTGSFSTAGMSNSDPLQIIYDDVRDAQLTTGTRKRFRDGFAAPFVGGVPDPAVWTLTNTDGHIVSQGGNSSGSSYCRISLNPLIEATEVSLVSKDTFKQPFRTGFGISLSQRAVGQEFFAGFVGDDGAGGVQTISLASQWNGGADMAVSQVVIASNVATVSTSGNHGLNGGDRVCFYGFADSRFNVGPVYVTPITLTTFTVALTAPNGTYTTGMGSIRFADPMRYAYNGAGHLWENSSPAQATLTSRRNGAKFRATINQSMSTTQPTQSNTSAYTDAFNAAGVFEQQVLLEEVSFRAFASDSGAGPNFIKFNQGIPDEDGNYRLAIRARTLTGFTRPVAKIATVSKTGTAVTTVTTTAPHGLTVNDFVQLYGIRDQTNFAPPASGGQVLSVIDATNFTISIGTSVTASSSDGFVVRSQGSVAASSVGVQSQAIQSIVAAGNVLTITGSGTWAGFSHGDSMYVYGLTSGLASYEGAYQVLRVSGSTTLELGPLAAGQTIPNLGSTATGGGVIKMTDLRLHFARVIDHTRQQVEVYGGRGNTNDINNSVPVSFVAGVAQGTGSTTAQWSTGGYSGFQVADVASGAITTTTTTSAIIPGQTTNVGANAHQFNIAVTAASGTGQTLDVGVEESPDGGTNWYRVYDFPRITGTGAYQSPLIPAKMGNRYRYVQTVGGTTPSFTRAINRVMHTIAAPFYKQFIDRSITLTSLSSTTPTYFVGGATEFQLLLALGTATTPPTVQLQYSEDGVVWSNLSATLPGVASSVVQNFTANFPATYVRAIVTAAGATLGGGNSQYVMIKALGR